MWPFHTRKPDDNLTKRVRDLEDEVHALKRDLKGVRAEWIDTESKFIRLLARAAKRMKDAERVEEEPPEMPQDAKTQPDPYQTTNPLALALLQGRKGA